MSAALRQTASFLRHWAGRFHEARQARLNRSSTNIGGFYRPETLSDTPDLRCRPALKSAEVRFGSFATGSSHQQVKPCPLCPESRRAIASQRNDAKCRYCCKSRKLQGDEFFANLSNKKQSPIRIASLVLAKSPVSFT